jgi:hypothetical protein
MAYHTNIHAAHPTTQGALEPMRVQLSYSRQEAKASIPASTAARYHQLSLK